MTELTAKTLILHAIAAGRLGDWELVDATRVVALDADTKSYAARAMCQWQVMKTGTFCTVSTSRPNAADYGINGPDDQWWDFVEKVEREAMIGTFGWAINSAVYKRVRMWILRDPKSPKYDPTQYALLFTYDEPAK